MLKFIQNFLVLSATLLVTLGLIELGLRHFMPVDYRPPPSELAYVGQESIYQATNLPGLDYELRPDIEAQAQGVLVKTNSYGMRDEEPQPEAKQRIVVTGDSFAFGFGVPQAEIFPLVLEKKLAEAGGSYDVLNLTVPGYTIRDEVAVLKHKGLLWQPDLIIVGYVLNDPEIEPVQELPSYFDQPSWWQYSHVLRLVARGKKKIEINIWGGGDYYRYLHTYDTTWRTVVTSFAEIRSLTEEQGIEVMLLIFPTLDNDWATYPHADLHQQVATLARQNGFTVVDLQEYFSNYFFQDLRISMHDGHPNGLAHTLAAEAVFEKLFPAK